MKIVITGGTGMVGKNIEDLILNDRKYFPHSFVFLNRSKKNQFTLDLTNRDAVLTYFENNSSTPLNIFSLKRSSSHRYGDNFKNFIKSNAVPNKPSL